MSLLQQKCLTTNDVNNTYRSQLETVQGYAVVGHGRDYVRIGLLTCRELSDSEKAQGRATIASLAPELTNACALYQSYEEYHAMQFRAFLSREESRQRMTPQVVKAFGLSSAGYTALGIPHSPVGPSYQTGPAGR